MEELQQPDLDDLSERVLAYVRVCGDDGSTVSDIVDAYDDLTKEDRGRIHDRINRKLEPRGLVERDEGAIETDGGLSDADVFRVTEWAEMYLDERDEPVTDVRDAAEVSASLTEAVGRIEDTETRVDAFEAELGRRLTEYNERLELTEEEVDGASEAASAAFDTAGEAREDARDAVDEVVELRSEVKDLEEMVDVLERRLKDEKNERRKLESALGPIGESEATVHQKLQWLSRNVRWVKGKVQTFDGFFDEMSEGSLLRGWMRDD